MTSDHVIVEELNNSIPYCLGGLTWNLTGVPVLYKLYRLSPSGDASNGLTHLLERMHHWKLAEYLQSDF